MKKILLIFCLMLHITTMWAAHEDVRIDTTQLSTLTGKIIDRNTKAPISNAIVRFHNHNTTAKSNAEGIFYLTHLQAGEYKVEIIALGYQKNTTNIFLHRGQITELDVRMRPDAFQLNEAVVTGNCFAEQHSHAATLVGVLSGATLNQVQAVDLAQGLKFQPGVRIENNCQNCGFSQVRINGLDGPYTQILIDSHPVFSSLAGVYGLEQIPANMIERVEVLRGGGSALYGASAIAGTINVITKDPKHNSAMASHELRGMNGLHSFENITRFNASLVNAKNNLGLTVFGQKRHRAGYDNDRDGYTELPQLDGSTLGLRTFMRPTNNTRLSLQYAATHEFRRGGDLLNKEPHDAHITEQIEHTNQNASFDFNFWSPNEHHKFKAFGAFMQVNRKSYYGGGDYTATELLDSLQQGIGNRESHLEALRLRMNSYGRTKGNTYLTGTQYTYQMNRLLFMPAYFTIGTEYKYNSLDDKSGFRPENISQSSHSNGVYLQNEWRNERLTLLLGARLDKHSALSKAIISPRFNLRYEPLVGLTLRAGYSKGFRAPQLFDEDLHVDNAGGELILSENAKNLKEEIAHSLTFSTDFYRCFGDWQLNLLVDGFYTRLVDAFAFDESSATRPDGTPYILKRRVNSSGAKVMGATLETKLAYRNLLTFQGGWTLQRSRWDDKRQWNKDDTYATRRIYRSPNSYAYFIAAYHPTSHLTIALNGNYTGSMLTGHEIPTEDNGTLTPFGDGTSAQIHADRLMNGPGQTATTYGPRTFKTPSFFELGMKISYNFHLLGSEMEAYTGVQNIFNAYQDDFDRGPARDSAYIYGPTSPRSYFVGLRVNL